MRTTKVMLRCEGLEGRDCPAVQVFNVAGTLTVVGSQVANDIEVVDNGTDVSVFVGGSAVTNSPFTGVTKVVVRGGSGDDTITYTASSLSAINTVKLQGGVGNDTITLNADSLDRVDAGAATTQFVIRGEQGADTIDASLGNVAAGDTIALNVSGGTGADNVTFGAITQAVGTMNVQITGDQGRDTISVSSNLAHGSTGTVNLNANGSQGVDNVTFTSAGEVDGTLTQQANGGQGSDTISLSTTIAPDSTGTVNVGTGGGQGVDTIDLDVTAVVGGALNILVTGGIDLDTITATTDIKTGSTGTVSSRVDGGLKRDTLTSLVTVDNAAATADDLNALFGAGNWSFTLDGNLGFDTGTFTDGVVTPISIETPNPV